MKQTILVCVVTAGLAWAQSPQIIQNTRSMMQAVQAKETRESNEALGNNVPSVQEATKKSQPGAQASPFRHGPAPAPAPAPAKRSAAVVKSAAVQPKAGAPPVKHTAGKKPPKVAVAPQKPAEKAAQPAQPAGQAEANAAEGSAPDDSTAPENKWAMSGKRDPFVSPVVSHAGGSGCSTGKKCLEIGDINLRGIVHSEAGFIAVVTNNLNKAYFLHENDPVFNGYVIKITGDSVTFKEMMQDRLGKPFTREVVKKIVAPAV
jgi:hypothetical protein